MCRAFTRRGTRWGLVVAVAVGLVIPATATAQEYFGRNKVQYHTLKFEVLKTEHFDVYFYPGERQGAALAARMAERWHTRLQRLFVHKLRGRQPLILYGSHTDFEQTNVIGGELPEGTGGVTEPLRRRIVLPLAGPLSDTDHVIGHELVHAFQFDVTSRPNMAPGENGAERLPLWFIEGMAEYFSLGPSDPNTAMWVRDAARAEKLPSSIGDLGKSIYFPYRWGQAFWAYVGGRWGDETIVQLFQAAASTGNVNGSIQKVLGISAKQLSSDWQASIRETYAPFLTSQAAAASPGRPVIRGKDLGAELNVGPAISPDGRWIAFLSERSFTSTDLYVADASTGHIVRRLTSTATDPHYSSIQFIDSAGAWDAASARIAVATVTAGHPALAIFDAQSGRREREIRVPEVDEILNPTWAPDGHALCFTGMTRGLTDLYVYDLTASTLRPLTHDVYADVQPSWSPDGRRIAFATDRFSSDVGVLSMGAYQLAFIDPESGAVDQVPAFPAGKQINPQWSPTGDAVYFISDRDGISNVYRVTLATGALARITASGTGVSGITNSSPALSVSSSTGTVAFSVYERGSYDIYTRDATAGETPAAVPADAAVLPPSDRRTSEVAALLANATLGLPEPLQFRTEPYKARLSLEGVAQPTVAVGVSRFGPAIGGGVSLVFSDILQNHLLGTAVQINSGFGEGSSAKNIAAEAMYLNQSRRWNWGVLGAQIPYLSGGFAGGVGVTPGGILVGTDRMIVFRQTEQSASGILAYPFDRARRVEFQGGASRISFDQVVNTTTYSLFNGAVLNDTTETTSLAPALTLGTSSAAYVFDTATYGAITPVRGQRYRVEADPTFGTIAFTGLLADYRRYVMPVSFYTIGARVMHYGRYGSGGEDPRLFPLYLGYPGLVRGYDATSFGAADCVASTTSACPAIDRLIGSRMLVGNLELRFPLLRPFGVSRSMYGPVPIEVALFTDTGVAWSSSEKPSWLGGSRDNVSSAGVAFRISLFGFAIGELDVARPFQRPGQGWISSFNLLQGW